jgi:sporadic carbohydrate cluster protein (TIGR04323 family)
MPDTEPLGFRGYIASRPIRGTSFPQKLQNLAVRDYAAQLGIRFKLSATEYAMPDCYMMLVAVLNDLPSLQGIISFSCFMLPARKERRLGIYRTVLDAGAQLHAALENLTLRSPQDIGRWEDLMDVSAVLAHAPFGGRYEKDGLALDRSLVRALERS